MDGGRGTFKLCTGPGSVRRPSRVDRPQQVPVIDPASAGCCPQEWCDSAQGKNTSVRGSGTSGPSR